MNPGAAASVQAALRDGLARLFRCGPYFPGKEALSACLNRRLTDFRSDAESLAWVRLRDGSWMRLDLRSGTEWYTYWTGQYDSRLLYRLNSWLRPGAVVLDVGANVGLFSIPLGRRLRELQGRLYAVEPVQANFERLVENIARNRLAEVVKPLRIALGASEGTAALYRDDRNFARTGNAVVLGGDMRAAPNATARLTCLDTLAAEQRIEACHVLKVDIEGAELALLQGGQGFLARHMPLICCELNYHWMGRRGWSFHDLLELIGPLGYRPYREVGRRLLPATAQGSGVEDLLLIPARACAQK